LVKLTEKKHYINKLEEYELKIIKEGKRTELEEED